jgi:hypothetical protein
MIDILIGVLAWYDRDRREWMREQEARWRRFSQEKWAPLEIKTLSDDLRRLARDMREAEYAADHPEALPPYSLSSFGSGEDKPPIFYDEWTPEQQDAYQRLRAIGARMLVRIERAREQRRAYEPPSSQRASA